MNNKLGWSKANLGETGSFSTEKVIGGVCVCGGGGRHWEWLVFIYYMYIMDHLLEECTKA